MDKESGFFKPFKPLAAGFRARVEARRGVSPLQQPLLTVDGKGA
jgi:hypothetical protein